MYETKKIEIKGNERIQGGIIELGRPLAGAKNKALIKAETAVKLDSGEVVTIVKESVFMNEIIPHCIRSHPFGTLAIKQALDYLNIEEYDMIVKELSNLLKPDNVEELKKKSEMQLDE